MREIDEIIVHCTDTYPDMDVGVAEVREWHVGGNGWSDVGYHFLIRRNGLIEIGRPLERPGAHVKGRNKTTIGVAMAGGKSRDDKPATNFTFRQWESLDSLVRGLVAQFTGAKVSGHNQYSDKACPTFDVRAWAEGIE